MYEDDTPPAERRAQALSLDRDLLRELLGQEELRDLLDPDALAEVERSSRGAGRDRPTSSTTLLRLRGDYRDDEFDAAHAAMLEAERRAVRVRIGGEERLIAVEDAGRYRDALGVMPPGGPAGGVPRGRRRRAARAGRPLCARTRPVHDGAGERAGFGVDAEPLLRELERDDKLVRGELRPGGVEREWCDPDVLRRLRRASLAALRQRGRAGRAGGARTVPARTGTGSTGGRRLREALVPLQGLPLPVVAVGERGAAAPRAGLPAGAARRALRTGEVVWVGAGLDRVALFFREDAPLLGAAGRAPRPTARYPTPCAMHSPAAPSSGTTCSRRQGSRTPRRRCRRSGSSSGRAR